jgi:putative oxidoreductase
MTESPAGQRAPKITADRALWGLQVAIFLLFIAAGGTKLIGMGFQLDSFEKIGFGQWLRYVVGTLEVTLGVALLVPRLVGVAALGLTGMMVGAVFTELFLKQENPTFAIVTLIAVGVTAWLRRDRAIALLMKLRIR